MIHLAFVWHMHQPYYTSLLTNEAELPWVRLHGIKDYLDMVTILEKYPTIHQTFNLVPSLIEQIQAYVSSASSDKFLRLSRKRADSLTSEEKKFIIVNFFMVNVRRVLSLFPRYNDLYFKAKENLDFNTQDILDLQVWFNLAWFDPDFRETIPELRALIRKARFFTEEEKNVMLDKQIEVLRRIMPTYKEYQDRGQIEVSITPYFHPILPLLYNSRIARTANRATHLPRHIFSFPEDCRWHVAEAVKCYEHNFGKPPGGMWPSEEAISKQILPYFMEQNINWIVTDESLLLRTYAKKKIDRAHILYQTHYVERMGKRLHILFRDKNLSDLIGFTYHHWDAEEAVADLLNHLQSIDTFLNHEDCLIVLALDGENCWEYYPNDGKEFLRLLYAKLSASDFIKTVTIGEYLKLHPSTNKLSKIHSGSWINGDFQKWIGHPAKNKAWEYLFEARNLLHEIKQAPDIAWKQMHILEGSDWFWWYGDKHRDFDQLFRLHLKNLYSMLNHAPKINLEEPLE